VEDDAKLQATLPALKILMLTVFEESEQVFKALSALWDRGWPGLPQAPRNGSVFQWAGRAVLCRLWVKACVRRSERTEHPTGLGA
jgi:hypothetical protein